MGQVIKKYLFLEAFKRNVQDTWLLRCQQVAQWGDAAALNKIGDLFQGSSWSRIRNCPYSFFTNLELGVRKQSDERRDQVGRNDMSNLSEKRNTYKIVL